MLLCSFYVHNYRHKIYVLVIYNDVILDYRFTQPKCFKAQEVKEKEGIWTIRRYSYLVVFSPLHFTVEVRSIHRAQNANEIKRRKFLADLKVETKICAILGILWANLKNCSTLKFMTNISFVPSICLHKSIIFIFIEKSMLLDFFHRKCIFPRFSIFISARILVSVTNSRLWYNIMLIFIFSSQLHCGTSRSPCVLCRKLELD